MTLSLLLDEHLPPVVAEQLRASHPEVRVFALQEWHEGMYLGADDAALLAAAHQEGLTLVTRDSQTIPAMLANWYEQGAEHAGVVFIDGRTIPGADIGGLVRALRALITSRGTDDWTNVSYYLERAG